MPDTEVIDAQIDRLTGPQCHQLDDSDAIVFGARIHMSRASAAFHTFAEASSRRWFTRKRRNKPTAGFTNSGPMTGDKSGTLGYFFTLAAQPGMTGVSLDRVPAWNSTAGSEFDLNRLGFFQGVGAQSNMDDKSDAVHKSDPATAEHLGHRVAELIRITVAGRRALQP